MLIQCNMFILYIASRYSYFNILFNKLWQRQYEFCHHLVSVYFNILIFSENPQPNELKLGRKHLWKVLSKEGRFCYDPLPNMAATGNSCFWLADFFKIFSETAWPNEPKLGRKHLECLLWRLLISSRSVSKHGHHMQFLFLIGRFLKKASPLKLLSHMNRNLVGSIYMYGRFCIKFLQSRMKGERHRLSWILKPYLLSQKCKIYVINDIANLAFWI